MSRFERFFEQDDWESGRFVNHDGRKIRFVHAKPKGESRGTVVITMGYADFSESYFETIEEYRSRGFEVWTMDWANRGKNGPAPDDQGKVKAPPADRDSIKSMHEHIRDLHQFRHTIVKHDSKKPICMSTHSMGGHIGLHYLKQHPKDFDFAVLAAPLFDFKMHYMTRKFVTTVLTGLHFLGAGQVRPSGSDHKIIRKWTQTRRRAYKDEDMKVDLRNAFRIMNRRLRAQDPTFDEIAKVFNSTSRLNKETYLKAITTPILVGLAENENLVDNDAALRGVGYMPNAKHVQIKDSGHGLWMERDAVKAEWWGHVDTFIEAQIERFDKGLPHGLPGKKTLPGLEKPVKKEHQSKKGPKNNNPKP